MRRYTAKGLIKFQQNMLTHKLSKSYEKLIIQYAEQVRKPVFVTSILGRHLVCPQVQK